MRSWAFCEARKRAWYNPAALEPIPGLAPSARGRARARQARRDDAGDITENIVEAAQRSMAGSQPAEARMGFWDRLSGPEAGADSINGITDQGGVR